MTDPWAIEATDSTEPDTVAAAQLAQKTLSSKPSAAEDYIDTETTLDGDVPLEAAKPGASRLQFWRNWR